MHHLWLVPAVPLALFGSGLGLMLCDIKPGLLLMAASWADVRAGGDLWKREAGHDHATRRGRRVVHGGRRGGMSGHRGSGAVWSGHLYPEEFPTENVLDQMDGPGPSPGCVGAR